MTPTQLKLYLNQLVNKRLQISTMIWGAPGIGKSSIVAQVAQEHNIDFLDVRLSQLAPTDLRGLPVAVDGISKWYPPEFLPRNDKGILFLDEINMAPPAMQGVLHAALLHVIRRGVREPLVWNVAADIVVNGMISQQGCFELPPGGLRAPQLEHLSVEEIYELLLKDGSERISLPMPDLISNAPGDCSDSAFATNRTSQAKRDSALDAKKIEGNFAKDSLSQARQAEIETHWRHALQQAAMVARTVNPGELPAGMERELSFLTSPQIDWRSYLWRYLVQTPTDFSGFDRRFVGRGLYLEFLVWESVQVYVAVDTSGSIDNEQLRIFLSEVQGILHAYPHLQCDLYYTDAEAYGPYPLKPDSMMPSPQGGGGTSFVPFFTKVQESWDGLTGGVCIYLTDGCGTFPSQPPQLPVLWVVTPGGLNLSKFPFGEAVRLLSV